MGTPPLQPDINAGLATLLRLFLAFSRAKSNRERSDPEHQVLFLFSQLGVMSDEPSIREARREFDLMRSEPRSENPRRPPLEEGARAFINTRLSDLPQR